MYERLGSGTRPDGTWTPRTGPGHLGRDPDTLDANRTLWTGPGHPGRGPDTLDGTRTREHAELMSCGFKRMDLYTRTMSCGFKRVNPSGY